MTWLLPFLLIGGFLGPPVPAETAEFLEVTGRIADLEGHPAAEALVTLERLDSGEPETRRVSARARRDGSYSLRVPEGVWRAEVSGEGEVWTLSLPPLLASRRLPIVELGGVELGGEEGPASPWCWQKENTESAEPPSATPNRREVSGRVVDRSTREPVPNAWLWQPGYPAGSVRSGQHGLYETTMDASTGIRAFASGYLPSRHFGWDGASPRGPTLALFPAPGRVTGIVTNSEGRPEADVVVVAEKHRRFQTWTVTDDAGFFEIRDLPGDESFHLTFRAAGLATMRERVSLTQDGNWQAELAITLPRASEIAGQVVDEEGRPLSAARVALHLDPDWPPRREVWTDEMGRFRLTSVQPGPKHVAMAADGFGTVRVETSISPGQIVDLGQIVLGEGIELLGTVESYEGDPIPSAALYVDHTPGGSSQTNDGNFLVAPDAFTDADGSFTLSGLASGDRIRLDVRADGFLPLSVGREVSVHPEPLSLHLVRAAWIGGAVVDALGEPIANAVVYQGNDWAPSIFREQRTDAKGRFGFYVEPAPLSLGVWAPGYARKVLPELQPLVAEDPDGGGGQPEAELEIELEAAAEIVGNVRLGDGRPAVDAWVSASQEPGANQFVEGFVQPMARTDGDGFFRMAEVPTGRVEIHAELERQSVRQELRVAPGSNHVELELRDRARVPVVGRVVDPNGSFLSGFELSLEPVDLSGLLSTRSDAEGVFELEAQVRTKYRLRVDREWVIQQPREGLHVGLHGISDLVVVATRPARVCGELFGFSDLDRVRLRIDAPGGGDVQREPGRAEYCIVGVLPGSWILEAREIGAAGVGVAVDLAPGEHERVDLTYDAGIVVEGHTIDEYGPYGGAWIRLEPAEGGEAVWTRSDADGSFRSRLLRPGSYAIRVSDRSGNGEVLYEDTVEVTDDDRWILEIRRE